MRFAALSAPSVYGFVSLIVPSSAPRLCAQVPQQSSYRRKGKRRLERRRPVKIAPAASLPSLRCTPLSGRVCGPPPPMLRRQSVARDTAKAVALEDLAPADFIAIARKDFTAIQQRAGAAARMGSDASFTTEGLSSKEESD